jgi:hypothetical protein
MDITLTVIEGPQKGKQFYFSDPDTFLLGWDNNGSTAHFRLNNDDTQVSRNHFLLEINPPDCFIRDAGSLNGTFIVRSRKYKDWWLRVGPLLKSWKSREMWHDDCLKRNRSVNKLRPNWKWPTPSICHLWLVINGKAVRLSL